MKTILAICILFSTTAFADESCDTIADHDFRTSCNAFISHDIKMCDDIHEESDAAYCRKVILKK